MTGSANDPRRARGRVAAVAAIVALVVGATVAIRSALHDDATTLGTSTARSDSSRPSARDDAHVAPESAAAATARAPASTTAPDTNAPARTLDATSPSPAEPPPPGPMVEPREGTIVVVDRDGVEHEEESGSLEFERLDPKFEQRLERGAENVDGTGDDDVPASPDPARAPVTVVVTRGRFVFDAARFRAIRLGAIELGGRLAVDDDVIKVASPEPIRVRALWVEPVLLHVRDAATKAELDDVTVVLQSEWTIDPPDHPGGDHPDDVVGRGLRAPFSLKPPLVEARRRFRAHYWIGAPGHAWSSASLHFDEGGEETVELEPAAGLTVVVGADLLAHALEQPGDPLERMLHRERPPPAPNAFVRVRRRPRDPDGIARETLALRQVGGGDLGGIVAEIPARDAEVRFERLAPGERLVTLEVGARNDPSLVIGFAEASLRAGESPTVTLARVVTHGVPLAGTLFVPPSWDAAQVELAIVPTDRRSWNGIGAQRVLPLASMAAVAGRPGLYRWRFDDVSEGTYQLSVDHSFASRWIEVGPDGRDDVEIVLPDVAHVTVRVVDAEHGAPVEVTDLHWFPLARNARRPDGGLGDVITGGGMSGRGASTFTLTLPAGPCRFIVQSDEWRTDDSQPEAELVAGDQQVDVRVLRSCGIVVECRVDGAVKPWPSDFDTARLTVVPIGEGASPINRSRFAFVEGTRFVVPEAGWYRITVPKLEGFAEVAPIDVFVEAKRFVTRTIELVRE